MQAYGTVQENNGSSRLILTNAFGAIDVAEAVRKEIGPRTYSDVVLSVDNNITESLDVRNSYVYATRDGRILVHGEAVDSLFPTREIEHVSTVFRGKNVIDLGATINKLPGLEANLSIKPIPGGVEDFDFEDYVVKRAQELANLGHVHSIDSLIEEWLVKWQYPADIDAEFMRIHRGCTQQKTSTPGGTSYVAEYGGTVARTKWSARQIPQGAIPENDYTEADFIKEWGV